MSKVKFINKYILQFLCIRIARNGQLINNKFVQNGWSILYWIKPLTGWKNSFIYLGKRNILKITKGQ